MAAYFVLMQQADDIDRYVSEYVPGVMPFLGKYGGELLAASFDAEATEGEPPGGVVVVKFPDVETARAFVNDPDYKPFKDLRHTITSNYQGVIAPEFSPPG